MKATAENDPCRVLQVTEAMAGGVRKHLQRIIPPLREQNILVDLLINTRRAEEDLTEDLRQFEDLGCRIAYAGGRGNLLCLFHGMVALREYRLKWKPDIIHLHATRAGIFGRMSRSGNVPIVYSPHGIAPLKQHCQGIHRALCSAERLLKHRTRALICVSRAEADQATAFWRWPEDRTVVIENGLEDNFEDALMPGAAVRREWGLPTDALLVGIPARLAPQKDPGTVLNALAEMRHRNSVHVIFCGNGPLRQELEQVAEKLGVHHLVSWMGYVKDLPRRMRAFDVTILPSQYEGLSYALLESLAAGIPVIAADIPANLPSPALAAAITRFEPGNAVQLARALEETLDNLNDRKGAAAAVAEKILAQFSVKAQAEKLATHYRTWADEKRNLPDTQA